ncbi:antibiotic biosynthesis monooxygenase family protein [Siccirubricoccus deserti]
MVPKAIQGLLPILRQSDGFAAYCVITGDDADLHSISLFDTREAANAAYDKVRAWVQANLSGWIRSPPEIMQGGSANHDLTQLRSGATDKVFARVNRYTGRRGSIEEMRRRVDQDILPVMRGQAGFRGFVNLMSDQDPTRGAAISFWQNAEAANAWASHFTQALLPKLRDILPDPPESASGMSVLLVTSPAAGRDPAA